MLPGFLKVNGDLRQINADEIMRLTTTKRRRRSCGMAPVQLATRRSGELRITGRIFIRARVDHRCTSARSPCQQRRRRSRQRRERAERELAGHLRQLHHHRPRDGRRVALRAFVVGRREGRRQGDQGADDRPQRHDRARRRRSSALHDARRRASGESGRVVGCALGPGPRGPEAARGRRYPTTVSR